MPIPFVRRPAASVRSALAAGVALLAGAGLMSAVRPAAALPLVPARNLVLQSQFNDFPPSPGAPFASGYASCWGYIHGDGREYALLGTSNGVAIYNVTNPAAAYLVSHINGPPSLWREVKSYRNWIYVVNEQNQDPAPGAPVSGLQIIRMTDPEHPVLVTTYAVGFNRTHTISVDTTRAILYCNGTSLNGSQTGVRILSLANPEAPAPLAAWPSPSGVPATNYVHDSVPIGNRLYASSIYVGIQRVLDVTNPAAPSLLASWTYPGAFYTHNSWPNATGTHLYVTDEQNGQTLRVFDISSLAAPTLVGEWSSNPQAIVHNAHVRGTDLWLANYTEGIRVLDISDPAHPAEFGWADTYGGSSGGYSGVWGVYPYFPSGTVIASDMQTGLWVFRVERDYGLLRVEVRSGGSPLPDATLHVTTEGDSSTTPADGIVRFAPTPGTHTVRATRFGYHDAEATVNVDPGTSQTVVLNLAPRAVADFSGTLGDAASHLPLEGGEVNLRYTHVHAHTDAGGAFHLDDTPDDFYRVDVRRPGYVPFTEERHIGPGQPLVQNYELRAAARWDNFSTPTGWTVNGVGDDATSGGWVRVEPYGTGVTQPVDPHGGSAAASARGAQAASIVPKPLPGLFHEGHEAEGATPGQVQPERDRTPGTDSLCYVTGNLVGNSNIDQADIDGGRTTLTSPSYDPTGMAVPTIGAWVWFYSQFRSPDDWLAVLISGDNGVTWVPADTLRGIRNHWQEISIRIGDHVVLTPATRVKVRFIAADLGAGSVVEAGVDDVTLYDAAQGPLHVPPGDLSRLAFRAPLPNPSRHDVLLTLGVPTSHPLEVDVLDVAGRRVHTLFRGTAGVGELALRWDGRTSDGARAKAGLYFVRARLGAEVSETRIVRVN